MSIRFPTKAAYAAALLSTIAGHTLAADGFKLRFPQSGTLGGEMVAPLSNSGLYGQLSVTQIELDKISGTDGNQITLSRTGVASGTNINAGVQASAQFTAGQKTAAARLAGRTANYSGAATSTFKQSQTQTNAVIGYLGADEYAGGRFTLAVNIPYITFDRTVRYAGTTPTLSAFSPAITGTPQEIGQSQGVGQAAFGATYQAALTQKATADTGTAGALGDIEVSGAWVYSDDTKKVIAGASLAMPTGEYDKSSTLNIGFGKYYTFRPSVAMAYKTTEALTLGGRASLGLNSPNTDNGIRSGNFYALDLAAAYLTPVGVVGPHVVVLNQYEDDQGGALGANRLSSTGAGLFFTTRIDAIGAGLNISYMKTVDSRNSLSGSFFQVRVSKAF